MPYSMAALMRKHTVCLLLEGRNGLSSLLRQTTVLTSKRVNTTDLKRVHTQKYLHPINTILSKKRIYKYSDYIWCYSLFAHMC